MISKLILTGKITAGLCAALSIVLSIWSITVSKEANTTANKAISLTQQQFVEANRPYLEVKPERFKNGSFMKFVEKADNCEIYITYKIENLGKGPATDILFPQFGTLSGEMLERGNKLKNFIPAPGTISLAPGEHMKLMVKSTMEPNKVTVKEYLKKYKDGTDYLGLDFQVVYRSEINNGEVYSTKSIYKIYVNEIFMDSYKHLKIIDQADVEGFNKAFDSLGESGSIITQSVTR